MTAVPAAPGAELLPSARGQGLTTAQWAKARHAAKEFEAVFLSEMFNAMYAGLSAEPPFGGGPAERIFRSLLIQEYAVTLAERGGVGIADAVLDQLLRAQEAK
jgi:Rod binding domain-containing protein